MGEEFIISKIKLEDATSLQILALNNDGNTTLNEENFNHWYLKNPTKSNSLWKVQKNNAIEGYATTNNFNYTIDNKDYLVALPQNVLTSKNIRGTGLFGKLYYKTEIENIEENGVDFFLTSTGPMSTPIFLNKFNYLRGICPNVLIKMPSLRLLFSNKNYSSVQELNEIALLNHTDLNNSRKKNTDYFKWRYSNCDKKNLKIISVKNDTKIIGYAFLIVKRKFGIKSLILADILSSNEESYSQIIDACHTYASKNLFAALILFELSCNCRNYGINLSFKNKFNILVKGKTNLETTDLSLKKINFFFGDLDYFW